MKKERKRDKEKKMAKREDGGHKREYMMGERYMAIKEDEHFLLEEIFRFIFSLLTKKQSRAEPFGLHMACLSLDTHLYDVEGGGAEIVQLCTTQIQKEKENEKN